MAKGQKNDQRVLAMVTHLLGLFTSFLGPLVVYLIEKDKKSFVKQNARHALNFQLSVILYGIISAILIIILIGILMLWALGIFATVMAIVAAVRSYKGEVYKYPLEINFIK